MLLSDAGFADVDRWCRADHERDLAEGITRIWLPSDDSVVLAYSALMIGWYIVHHAPALTGVLLGMADPIVAEFRKVGIGDLAGIARDRAHWIQPRWKDRIDVWSQIRESDPETIESDRNCTILRCLKASAGVSPRLLASMEVSC